MLHFKCYRLHIHLELSISERRSFLNAALKNSSLHFAMGVGSYRYVDNFPG